MYWALRIYVPTLTTGRMTRLSHQWDKPFEEDCRKREKGKRSVKKVERQAIKAEIIGKQEDYSLFSYYICPRKEPYDNEKMYSHGNCPVLRLLDGRKLTN